MGDFIYTALIREFRVSTSVADPAGVELEKTRSDLAEFLVDNPDLYSCVEECGMLRWKWKEEARRGFLIDLLSRYYADFYDGESKYFAEYCRPVIDFLDSAPTDEDLIRWAEEKGSEVFYPMNGWVRMAAFNGRKVKVYVSLLRLSSEGKVIDEEMHRHLTFFEKALRIAYLDNPLGGCLTVDMG